MSSPHDLLARPSTRLALGLPSEWSADQVYTRAGPPRAPPHPAHQHNINNGHGIFNNVNGLQNFNMNVAFHFHTQASIKSDTFVVIEPYQSAICSLTGIIRLLDALPQEPSVSDLREEVRKFAPIVACVAKAMDVVRRVFPQFATHTFFSNMDSQAREYDRRLKELKADIYEYTIYLSDIMVSSRIRQIFLLIFPPHRWLPLSHQIRHFIRANQASLEQFLHVLVNPRWHRIVDKEHGELRRLITSAGLTSEADMHHLAVATIWIREPSRNGFHAIPLSFCSSWRDFALVVYQIFKHGPEGLYIQRGSWEVVHVDENRTVEESNFADALQPEAVFDIGIVLQLTSRSLYSCPQCGHENSYTNVNLWVSCTHCDNMFRVMLNAHSNPSEALDGEVPQPLSWHLRASNFRRVSARIHIASDRDQETADDEEGPNITIEPPSPPPSVIARSRLPSLSAFPPLIPSYPVIVSYPVYAQPQSPENRAYSPADSSLHSSELWDPPCDSSSVTPWPSLFPPSRQWEPELASADDTLSYIKTPLWDAEEDFPSMWPIHVKKTEACDGDSLDNCPLLLSSERAQ